VLTLGRILLCWQSGLAHNSSDLFMNQQRRLVFDETVEGSQAAVLPVHLRPYS
jgi:hypothetical protein